MNKRFLATLLLSCLLAVYADAQVTTVTSMTETTDFIPGDDQRRDLNNKPCALVKVQSLDDISEVEGNVMGDIVNRGVEKRIYMAEGSRNMKIHLKNNLPVTIKFRDYNITALKGNRVYSVVLNTPNQPKANESVKGNYLRMHITPQNANVAIWGENMQRQVYRPKTDGSLFVFLPYGRYNYHVSANGYKDYESSVFVNDENAPHTVELVAEGQTVVPHDQIAQQRKETEQKKPKIKKPSPFDIEHKVVFGVRAGANASWTQFAEDYGNSSMLPSFHAGVSMEVPITKMFYFNTALLYSNKGYKFEDNPLVEKATAQYIDLPLQVSVRFGDAEKTQFQINVGPYLAMLLYRRQFPDGFGKVS